MENKLQVDTTIQQLINDHQRILDTVNGVFLPLTSEQRNWKPATESWSITECLAHLNLANTYYVRQVQTKLERAGTRSDNSMFSMSRNGRLMMKTVGPEATFKVPAPGMMKPKPNVNDGSVFANFIEVEKLFIKLLPETNRLDWQQSKISSPLFTWLKFRLGDVLIFTAGHAQRHTSQALRVMKQPGFPF